MLPVAKETGQKESIICGSIYRIGNSRKGKTKLGQQKSEQHLPEIRAGID